MTNLVIVESAAKAKTIEKYLCSIPELKDRGTFKVLACFGHVRDLPAKTLGVDTDTWEVEYVPVTKKGDALTRLRQAAKDATKVYIASDPDREGEAIAFHLRQMLKLKRGEYARVAFHEITKPALKDAFLNRLTDIDMAQVDAQEARRVLDRVVGYQLSPLLWRRFSTGSLSAGRVQSAALKMIVDRAKEAEAHDPETFWTIEGDFELRSEQSGAPVVLHGKAHTSRDEGAAVYDNAGDVAKTVEWFAVGKNRPKRWTASFASRAAKKNPSAPFTTSSLQQEAYERHRIPAKRTMQLAQGLYEAGHITYMRTDSTNMSEEARAAIVGWVEARFGDGMAQPRVFKTKDEHAQEAHECIRPTQVGLEGGAADTLAGDDWTAAHRKLYDLIWRRAVASQMAPAEYCHVTYDITPVPAWNDFHFHGSTQVLTKEGFLRVYHPDQRADPAALAQWSAYLGDAAASDAHEAELAGLSATGDATRATSLFHEPSLVKALEKQGIGRPSTYATILDKLFERGYVEHGCNPLKTARVTHFSWNKGDGQVAAREEVLSLGGKEKDRMVPTSLGARVAEYIESVVPFLVDAKFTAEMEAGLDVVSAKKKDKRALLGEFYGRFRGAVEAAQGAAKAAAAQNAGDPRREEAAGGEKRPSKVMRTFGGPAAGVDLVGTRYGPALYVAAEQRFVSVKPFLEWRGKEVDDLTDADAAFLAALPMRLGGTSRTVAIGMYGLYVKDGATNIPLPRELWDRAYDGTLAAADVDGLTRGAGGLTWKKAKAPAPGRKPAASGRPSARATRKQAPPQ